MLYKKGRYQKCCGCDAIVYLLGYSFGVQLGFL